MSEKQTENCIIDNRVSDDKQLQGNGLDDQEIVTTNLVKRRNWKLLKIFSKSHSGRKMERSDFEEAIDYIKEQKRKGVQVHYYVVKSIDRFTRNGAVSYTEMKERLDGLGVQLIDAYGIIQPTQNTLEHHGVEYDWSRYSPSETSELMEATRSKAEVRDILTRMVSAEITLTKKGYSMRAPNDGYENTKMLVEGREQSVLKQNDERAVFYKEMFRLRATGRYTDAEIVKKVNALGYKSRPHKRWLKKGKDKKVIGMTQPKKLTVKQLQKVMTRTMYAGVKFEKWNAGVPIWAVFSGDSSPIVSITDFNKANKGKVFIRITDNGAPEVLYNYNEKERSIKTRRKFHPDYKYDKLIVCECCQKPLKNSGKGNKGKLGTYYKAHHCDRTENCKKYTGRIPQADFEQSVKKLLNNIKFTKEFEKKLEEKLIKKYRLREKEILSSSIKIGANVNSLKVEQESLLESLYATKSTLVREKTEEKIELLQKQIDQAAEERDKIEIKERDIKSFVRYAKDLMEHPTKMLADNHNPVRQGALFNLVFDSSPTYREIVSGTPKLALVFRLSEEFKVDKSALVTQVGQNWNQITWEMNMWLLLGKELKEVGV